jgi:hypothetical protein
VSAQATEPRLSKSFAQGQSIELDLPAGHYTMLLTTWADVKETAALGQGCTEVTVTAGAQVCFDLSVQAAALHGSACVTNYECVGAAGGTCCPSGCADLDSDVDSCGTCGNQCAFTAVVGTRCENGACRYDSCQPGHLDCDGQAATGCECAVGTSCCGTGCAVAHDNGIGGSWIDCTPRDTYNGTTAQAAFDSATNITGGALVFTCNAGSDFARSLCKADSTGCVCWWYDATGSLNGTQGQVTTGPDNGHCPCPGGSKVFWH